MLLEESEEGLIRNYDPAVKLLGAINREGVTCYLDALLFAMFARLGSFEAMLYKNIEDAPRKRLAMLLRLWVNILRAGKLITTDIVRSTLASLKTNILPVRCRRSKYNFNCLAVVGQKPPNCVSKMPLRHLRSLHPPLRSLC